MSHNEQSATVAESMEMTTEEKKPGRHRSVAIRQSAGIRRRRRERGEGRAIERGGWRDLCEDN